MVHAKVVWSPKKQETTIMEQQLKYVLNLIVSPQKKSTALAYIFNNRFHKINSSHDCKRNTQDGTVGFHQGCIVAYVDTIVRGYLP